MNIHGVNVLCFKDLNPIFAFDLICFFQVNFIKTCRILIWQKQSLIELPAAREVIAGLMKDGVNDRKERIV